MGNTTSSDSNTNRNKKSKNNTKLYNLIKVQSDYDSERNTINFSRRDLANTLSDRSIIDIMHTGGSKNIKLKNKPTRDRYSQYETQRLHNKNQNLIGGLANQFSPVSEAEFNGLKNLVMKGAGCGCAENSVLNMNGGFANNSDSSYNPINSITMSEVLDNNNFNVNNGSATSSFMPSQNMDLSATSISDSRTMNGSVTSSFMPSQVGSALMSPTSMSDSRTMNGSATSSFMPSQNMDFSATSMSDSRTMNGSATSSFMPSQVGSALMSATSMSNAQTVMSATSSFMPSQNGDSIGYVSESKPATNNILHNLVETVSVNSTNSNINRLQKLTSVLMGGNMSDISSFTMSTVSRTSENAVNYHDLIGGAGDDTETDGKSPSSSSSTTTTERSSDENTESTLKNTESTESTLKNTKNSGMARLTTETTESTESNQLNKRSAKASSTSSSNTTGSSSSSHSNSSSTGGSSSTSRRTSDSSNSSNSSSTESHKMSQQIYLSSTMSEGNIINAKQFYSSDHGELYSSETNYLRHNLTKRRFR